MFTTEEQREVFNLILDLNYNTNREIDPMKRKRLEAEVETNLKKLETLMGTEAYNTFMRRGKQMFAPIQ